MIRYLTYKQLLENRQEDVLKKFQKEYGEKLGLSLWESDPTKNKAYIEWLLPFVKRNEKDLGIDEIKKYETENNIYNNKINKIKLLLSGLIKKYDNNKNSLKPINQIKSLDELTNILDEKDFNELLKLNDDKKCKIWYNDIEWIVFQPFTFECSKYANRKERNVNWCTSYNENKFIEHNCENGSIIYCINKLYPIKDVAFELLTDEIVVKWDSNNNSEIISVYDMKNQFEKDSKIYELFDIIEHEVEFPKFSIEKFQNKAKLIFKNWDLHEIFDLYIAIEYLDSKNFVKIYKKDEIEYFTSNFDELLNNEDDVFDKLYNFLVKRITINKLLEYFNCNKNELKEKMINSSHDKIEKLLDDYNYKKEFVSYYINNKYKHISSFEDFYNYFIGDIIYAKDQEILDIIKRYFDEDEFIEFLIDKRVKVMSVDELIDLIYVN